MNDMQKHLTHRTTCRICRSTKLRQVLSFGPTSLANAFLTKKEIYGSESYFPLDVYLCEECSLVQLLDVVDPRVLFKDYVYVSSTSPVFREHFETFAKKAWEKFGLSPSSFIVDIGSNDGILLRPFTKLGAQILGVEPDKTIAGFARKSGVSTISEFFTSRTAQKILKRYGSADMVTATNVFAHIDDIEEVALGVKTLLKKEGVFMMEASYLVDVIEKNLFDTVYHEHLSYYSVSALKVFFERVGMKIVDVERVASHGGSLRVFAQKKEASGVPSQAVGKLLALERRMKFYEAETYHAYGLRILVNRAKLLTLLSGLKKQGKRIAGYGAPAKGNTLLNFFSIGNELLDYIVDDSAHKQGKYTPGKRIPVVSPVRLVEDPPDYLLILAWNFAPSIMAKHNAFRRQGGRFIIPVPTPRIIK